MPYTATTISAELAEQLCREITADLPEYFGLRDCNERYAQGMKERINFSAQIDGKFVGLLSLEYPYSENSQIYWMGIFRKYHRQGIGQTLIAEAKRHAKKHGAKTMTVETLSPSEGDKNYFRTYQFYESQNFKPLFNLKPIGYKSNMVYMMANLLLISPSSQDSEIKIQSLSAKDIPLIVSEFAKHEWPKPTSIYERYIAEQIEDQRHIWLAFYQNQFAGYVTLKWDSAYRPFKEKHIPEIMDLNVLPPFRKKGIASLLLNFAEKEAKKRSNLVGLGVGLYEDYGNAQKLYTSRGYQPDGLGVTYNYQPLEPGSMVCLDDDLIFWFTKNLT